MARSAVPASSAGSPAARGKWRTLAAVAIATFMLLLDVTVVNVALPEVQRDLGAGFTDLQWVIDAYALTLAATLLIAGSLADRLGRRRLFVAGLGLFSLSSLACALAWSPLALNLSRGLQGVGAAAMLGISLALIGAAYTGRDRHVALAVWGATSAGAVAIGPMVGGALIEVSDWESIFFLNVPVGLLTIALVARSVPESRGPSPTGPPDFAGVVTLAAFMTLLVLALLRGNEVGWLSATMLALLGGAAVLLAAFLEIERRASHPLLDLSLFRNASTVGASISVLLTAISIVAMLTFLVLYIQNALGYGPLETGLRLFPLTIASFFAAAMTARLARSVAVRWMLAGGLAVAGAGLLMARAVEPGSDWTALLVGGVLIGAGFGIVNPAVGAAAIGTVPSAKGGMASGLNSTFRLLGVAVGVALLGSIHEQRAFERFRQLVPEAPESVASLVASGRVEALAARAPAGLEQSVADAAETAFVAGFDRILLVAALVAFAGSVLALVLVRARDFVVEPQAAAPVPPAPAHGRREPEPAYRSGHSPRKS